MNSLNDESANQRHLENGPPENFPINNSGPSTSRNISSGLNQMKNPQLNKGMGFTLEERQALGIHGLLPGRFLSQDDQLKYCKKGIEMSTESIQKYMYLMDLLDCNEKLFYYFVAENIQELMPYLYTPAVGEACQKYSYIFKPRGLFITIKDKGHVYDVLRNWPETDVKAIVVTDGERILGLGDQGANGMGIPVGKLALYTAVGGVRPHQTLPITLDVGTNNEKLLNDELYIGLKQKRVSGCSYTEFIDEFMKAAVKRYGQNVLIQFEDFGRINGPVLIEKYKKQYCTFNDDIQGTAASVLSGLLTSLRMDQVNQTKISEFKVLILGAGQAGIGIAELCVKEMVRAGKISEEEARLNFWLVDITGLVTSSTPNLSDAQKKYAHEHENISSLKDIIAALKPSVLIGAAGARGAFSKEVLEEMKKHNARPVILSLSNPTSQAECTAEEAYNYTKGQAIFASGSPFDPVTYEGRKCHPGQANNSYIFPGVALGVIAAGMHHIPDEVFLLAAETLSNLVENEDIKLGRIYPCLQRIQECSFKIAVEVVKYAYVKGTATAYPEPRDKEKFVRAHQYDYMYSSALPPKYDWENK